MEAVDDEHRLLSLRGVVARHHLAGEALTTLVDGSNPEGVLTAWGDGDLHAIMAPAFDVLSVVETTPARSRIDDIT